MVMYVPIRNVDTVDTVGSILTMEITNRDISWYALAVKVANTSDSYDRHGCVLVKNGCVLGKATNRRVISHPVSNKFFKRDIHAEQRVILRVKHPKGSTLYSARDHKNPSSYPCNMCEILIKYAGIKWVVFHNGTTLEKVRV